MSHEFRQPGDIYPLVDSERFEDDTPYVETSPEPSTPQMAEEPDPPRCKSPRLGDPHIAPPYFEPRMRHAFIVVGREFPFLVHMQNFWMEGHNLELVLRASFEESVAAEIKAKIMPGAAASSPATDPQLHQDTYPHTIYVVNNEPFQVPYMIPQWRRGRGSFRASVYVNHANRKPEGKKLPWDMMDPEADKDAIIATDTRVDVCWVVHYRHSNENITGRMYEDYLLFGEESATRREAHIMHSPTVSPRFLADPPVAAQGDDLLLPDGAERHDWHRLVVTPDYDHVATLDPQSTRSIPAQELTTGLMASVKKLPWDPLATYVTNPLPDEAEVEVLYHGITRYEGTENDPEPLKIKIAHTHWFSLKPMNRVLTATPPDHDVPGIRAQTAE